MISRGDGALSAGLRRPGGSRVERRGLGATESFAVRRFSGGSVTAQSDCRSREEGPRLFLLISIVSFIPLLVSLFLAWHW